MKTLHIIIKNTRDPDRLLNKLRNSYKTQFSTLTDCKEALFVQSYIKLLGNYLSSIISRVLINYILSRYLLILLEWQMVAKVIDGNEDIELNSSVLDCLKHACKGHWDLPEGKLMSPTILSQQHDVSPRQYQKVVLEVKAAAKEWDDVDRLLVTKACFILKFCKLIIINDIKKWIMKTIVNL